MRALVQRVTRASVGVGSEVVGAIERGVVTLLGVASGDGSADGRYLAEKIVHLRIFADEDGRFAHSVLTVGGSCLLVSQFTLLANTRRGRRPDFLAAAPPDQARPLVDEVARTIRSAGVPVAEGRFGAHMTVSLDND